MGNHDDHDASAASVGRLQSPFFAREPDWTLVEAATLVETVTGHPPAQATWFRTAWTPAEFHVLFHAEDSDPWATHGVRDAPLYEEEVLEVFLDPVGDLRAYFEIEVNPLNTVLDLVLRKTANGYRKDKRWRCEGLRTSVTCDERSWTAHLAIPFTSLVPEVPETGTVWRGNFFRIDRPEKAPRELSAWSATGRATFHTPERFGMIEFIR